MKRFTKNHQTAIILGLLVALATTGYYLLFNMLFAEINQTAEILAEVAEAERVSGSIATNRQLVVELSTELEAVDSFFITADGVVDFIESVEDLARTLELEIDVRSVSLEAVAGTSYSELVEKLQIRLETQGAWQDNYNFLVQLEHLPFNLDIILGGFEYLDNPNNSTWRGSFDLTVLKLKNES